MSGRTGSDVADHAHRTQGRHMSREYKPPSPKTISTFVYLAVLVIGVLLAFVAVRALLA